MSRSFRDTLAAFFRHKRLMFTVFTSVCLAVVVLSFLLPQKFESRMKILVQKARADVVVTAERTNGPWISDINEEEINSEIALLKSRDVLERCLLYTSDAADE